MQARAGRLSLGLFACIYLLQGIVMSYFITFNILYLGQRGFSAGEVGAMQAVLVLPFVVKIAFAWISDHHSLLGLGHRRPYILVGLLVQSLCLTLLPSVPLEGGLSAFLLCAVLASTGMALLDAGTDGLAIDLASDAEAGRVQSVMMASRFGGMLLMLVVGAQVAEALGWSVVYALCLLPVPAILVLLGRAAERPGERRVASVRSGTQPWIRRRSVLLLMALGLVYTAAMDGILTFLGDYLNRGLSTTIGVVGLLVAVSIAGRVLGALLLRRAFDRLGPRRSLAVAVSLSSVACLGLVVADGMHAIAVSGLLFGLAYGYFTTAYAACAMRLSDQRIAATTFAVFMTIVNLGVLLGQAGGGQLVDRFGFRGMVLAMGLVNLLGLPLLWSLGGIERRPARGPASAGMEV